MEILSLHHVAIICSDYVRSKAFYTEVLPFKIISETYREERDSHKLDLSIPGGGQIELFSFPSPPPRTNRPEALGLRHLAFLVKDIDTQIASLEAVGVAVEPVRVDPVTGQRFTFFADPDGLPIELYGTG
jgi:glyoxylase I family protein